MARGQGLCCHRKLHCVGQVCPRQQRKLPTRTDKLAAKYLAYVRLASIRQWLAAFPYEAISDSFIIGHATALPLDVHRLGHD
jgi:hypothetical protein